MNWGFVVLGAVLVVFPQRHILVSASLQVLVQVRPSCFAVFAAHMRRMLPMFSVPTADFSFLFRLLVVGTWRS